VAAWLTASLTAQQYQQFRHGAPVFRGIAVGCRRFQWRWQDDFVGLTSTGQIRVVLGTGKTFAFTDLQFPAASAPLAAVAADFSGDANWYCGHVSRSGGRSRGKLQRAFDSPWQWRRNVSTFQPHVDFAVPIYPYGIAVGDLNGEGNLDIVVTGSPASLNDASRLVSVLLGNGGRVGENRLSVCARHN
jgi:hypothetical protein